MLTIKEENTYNLRISESNNGIRNGWMVECETKGNIDKVEEDRDIIIYYDNSIYYFKNTYWNRNDGIGIGANMYRFHCVDYREFKNSDEFVKELM